MPGKKAGEGSWTFLTPPILYRNDIAAADTNDRATARTLPIIDLSRTALDAISQSADIGYDNRLHIYPLMPDTVTDLSLQIYAKVISDGQNTALLNEDTPIDLGIGSDPDLAWAKFGDPIVLTEPKPTVLTEVPPLEIVILVSAYAGTGNAHLFYARSN